MQRRRKKIVVVGAGPAGSVAAERLAQSGHEVVVLERARFPRDKVCAGGLGPSALGALADMGLKPHVMALAYPIHGVRLTVGGQSAVMAGPVSAAVLPRSRFDALLAEHARRVGARVEEQWPVTGLLEEGGRVCGVRGSKGEVEGDLVLVAAGGTTSLVLRPKPARRLHCVYRRVSDATCQPGILDMVFRSGYTPGYAWFFPEGEGNANVGLCVPEGVLDKNGLEAALDDVLETEEGDRLVSAQLGPVQFMGIRVSNRPQPECRPGLWTMGEAGALVHSVTGEGIGPAMISGLQAARAVELLDEGEDVAGRAYVRSLWRHLGPTFVGAPLLGRILEGNASKLIVAAARGPVSDWGARLASRIL